MGVAKCVCDDDNDKESTSGVSSYGNEKSLLFPRRREVVAVGVIEKDTQDIVRIDNSTIIHHLVVHKAEILEGTVLPICEERV